ncbi:MAG: glycosyltransferase family 4 protein [bacterium]|nr:glycosyltransferase family 4 protein [bacterium]
MKKKKLIYILPTFNRDTSTHIFYLYTFIEALSKHYDMWLITLSGDDPRDSFSNITRHSYFGNSWRLTKIVRLASVVKVARFMGYKTVYVHYSYWTAIVASLIMRALGGTVYYWNCGMPWLFGKQRVLRLVLRFVHTLVTGTEIMADEYARHYGISREKIKVMPNWIDVARFDDLPSREEARKKLSLPVGVPIVLFVHKLVARKGADFLPGILNKLDSNIHMVIVGGGELYETITKGMSRLGLSNRTHFVGWSPAYTIPLYMRAADVYVMPSREEGFPRTILEAMASGTPFVATDVGGMRDIVPKDLAENVLVSAEDVEEEFPRRVSRILGDHNLQSEIVARLKNYVRQYETERVIEKFYAIVE